MRSDNMPRTGETEIDDRTEDNWRELPPDGHPLLRLGARLTELLDDDHWAECESLLLDGWEFDRIDRKTGLHWRENSALEVWFPFAYEELVRLRVDVAQLRDLLADLELTREGLRAAHAELRELTAKIEATPVTLTGPIIGEGSSIYTGLIPPGKRVRLVACDD